MAARRAARRMLGADDDPAAFTPVHPLLAELSRRHPGVRVGRSGPGARGTGPGRARAEGGEPGGPPRLALPAAQVRRPGPGAGPGRDAGLPGRRGPGCRIPSWEWHRAGVEAVRARTIAAAAGWRPGRGDRGDAPRPTPTAGCGRCPGSARGPRPRSGSVPAATRTRSPSATTTCPPRWAGRWPGRVVDDAGMLELLAPYRGHRYRAARLIELGGARPPRRGPRMPCATTARSEPHPARARGPPEPAPARSSSARGRSSRSSPLELRPRPLEFGPRPLEALPSSAPARSRALPGACGDAPLPVAPSPRPFRHTRPAIHLPPS